MVSESPKGEGVTPFPLLEAGYFTRCFFQSISATSDSDCSDSLLKRDREMKLDNRNLTWRKCLAHLYHPKSAGTDHIPTLGKMVLCVLSRAAQRRPGFKRLDVADLWDIS